MSIEKFDDDCPGCRPAILNIETGTPLADDSPIMKKVMDIWNQTNRMEREAFHRVMCQNSRDPDDMVLVTGIIAKMEIVCQEIS